MHLHEYPSKNPYLKLGDSRFLVVFKSASQGSGVLESINVTRLLRATSIASQSTPHKPQPENNLPVAMKEEARQLGGKQTQIVGGAEVCVLRVG